MGGVLAVLEQERGTRGGVEERGAGEAIEIGIGRCGGLRGFWRRRRRRRRRGGEIERVGMAFSESNEGFPVPEADEGRPAAIAALPGLKAAPAIKVDRRLRSKKKNIFLKFYLVFLLCIYLLNLIQKFWFNPKIFSFNSISKLPCYRFEMGKKLVFPSDLRNLQPSDVDQKVTNRSSFLVVTVVHGYWYQLLLGHVIKSGP